MSEIGSPGTANQRKMTLDVLSRFLAPARGLFEEPLEYEERKLRRTFGKFFDELMTKGFEYLKQPEEYDDSVPKFRPYRRLLKVLNLYLLENKSSSRTENPEARTEVMNRTNYTTDQLDALRKDLEDDKIKDVCRRTFLYSEYLAKPDIYQFFELISEDSMESFNRTAIFIEQSYKAWDKIAKLMGFTDFQEFIGYFLYYNRKTGKLQVLVSSRVFTEKRNSVIPVKNGIRDINVNLTNHNEDVEEIEEAAETMGIERSDLNDEILVKHLSAESFGILIEIAQEFIHDLYKIALSPDVLTAPNGDISGILEPFQLPDDNGNIPERFHSIRDNINKVNREMTKIKLDKNRSGQEITAQAVHEGTTKTTTTTTIRTHPCGPDCHCNKSKTK